MTYAFRCCQVFGVLKFCYTVTDWVSLLQLMRKLNLKEKACKIKGSIWHLSIGIAEMTKLEQIQRSARYHFEQWMSLKRCIYLDKAFDHGDRLRAGVSNSLWKCFQSILNSISLLHDVYNMCVCVYLTRWSSVKMVCHKCRTKHKRLIAEEHKVYRLSTHNFSALEILYDIPLSSLSSCVWLSLFVLKLSSTSN